jgi:hypothetical protein
MKIPAGMCVLSMMCMYIVCDLMYSMLSDCYFALCLLQFVMF